MDTNTEGEDVTLTEFLLARITEDELAIRENDMSASAHTGVCGYDQLEYLSECKCQVPARVLAECKVKRRIVEDLESLDAVYPLTHDPATGGRLTQACVAVQHLAAVYAGHPDYRDGWKP